MNYVTEFLFSPNYCRSLSRTAWSAKRISFTAWHTRRAASSCGCSWISYSPCCTKPCVETVPRGHPNPLPPRIPIPTQWCVFESVFPYIPNFYFILDFNNKGKCLCIGKWSTFSVTLHTPHRISWMWCKNKSESVFYNYQLRTFIFIFDYDENILSKNIIFFFWKMTRFAFRKKHIVGSKKEVLHFVCLHVVPGFLYFFDYAENSFSKRDFFFCSKWRVLLSKEELFFSLWWLTFLLSSSRSSRITVTTNTAVLLLFPDATSHETTTRPGCL